MIKVASYCRVSTDKEDQANSFEAQRRYFREYIQLNPKWELYEVYADEGITGTSTKKRVQFNRMIDDAYQGKFQLIITKEVSRFSRNILDTIAYTRELKAIGIGVKFLLDSIFTLDPDAEMYLTMMASMAQEESRRTSNRVVWGQTRQMERGVVFGHSLLGYDVKNGELMVNHQGAEIVRLIFHKYAMEQSSTSNIAKYLTQQGYPTGSGSTEWRTTAIIKILKNEKYVGDLVQKKTYTPDYLTHEKKANKGVHPLITVRNHHEPIISRELWDSAQERLRKNNKHGEGDWGHSNRYVFSGKIKCGQCGSSFVGRWKYRKDGSKIRRWSCGRAAGSSLAGCNIGKLVRDDDAMVMLKTAVRSLCVDINAISAEVTEIVLGVLQMEGRDNGDKSRQLRYEEKRILDKKERVLDAYLSQQISSADMRIMNGKYDHQLAELNRRLDEIQRCREICDDAVPLRITIKREVEEIVRCETDSEVYYKALLDSLWVFHGGHMELRLVKLPFVFRFEI